MSRQYFVYILTNRYHTVLYTGVTRDLARRMWEHRSKAIPGFTSRCNVTKLVFYETADDPYAAIAREKQIKPGSRAKTTALVNNPDWRDLSDDLGEGIASSLRSSQ